MEEQRFGSDRAYNIVTEPSGAAAWLRKAIRRVLFVGAVLLIVLLVLLGIGAAGTFFVDCCGG